VVVGLPQVELKDKIIILDKQLVVYNDCDIFFHKSPTGKYKTKT